MVRPGKVVHGRVAIVVAGHHVNVRLAQEAQHNLVVTCVRRSVEGGPAILVADKGVGVAPQQFVDERKVAEGRGTDEGSLTTRSVAMLNEPLRVADDPLEGREVVSVDGTEDGGSQLGVEGCGASSPLEGCDDILGELTRREGAVSWTVPLGE